MNDQILKSTLSLFKGIPILDKDLVTTTYLTETIHSKTIQLGFLFHPDVLLHFSEGEIDHIIDLISNQIGISGLEANQTFHKSWKTISESTYEQLLYSQILHYISTYGFESLGIYKESLVYIPKEKLDIPNIDIDSISLVIIRGYTIPEIKNKTLELIQSGLALHQDTMLSILNLSNFLSFTIEEIQNIPNKEMKIQFYTLFNILPEDPIEFLRTLIYLCTTKTLLIKSKEVIKSIQENLSRDVILLFQKYQEQVGLEKLAEIFYRFKPIFLAFKTRNELKPIINRIRKLANTHHKPFKEDYLNSITSKIKNGISIDQNLLSSELNRVNIFRKIRLAYALQYRTKESSSILYTIRNGKAYSKDFDFSNFNEAKNILDIVLESISNDLRKKVENRKIYIPDFIEYALPVSEKQFIGMIPTRSSIHVPENLVFGIHWLNLPDDRIDLDLSLLDSKQKKIGWNGIYKTENEEILFSGDMTNAPPPHGACELFYIKGNIHNQYLVYLNYFNIYDEDMIVDYKIIFDQSNLETIEKDYMTHPNTIFLNIHSKMDTYQKLIGLVQPGSSGIQFFLNNLNMGKFTSSKVTKYTRKIQESLNHQMCNGINLKNLLLNSGAILSKSKEDCDLDLSPESLEKDTFLILFS